ncbi:MAG: amidohydrolase family protein [Verrucomicrobiota bacterium]
MSSCPYLCRVQLLTLQAFLIFATSTFASDIFPPGFRPKPVGVHALVGGKVVTKPGETIDGATIVIRDGYFEAVGKNVSMPADARVWDASGLTIYAGFIESYLPVGQTNQAITTSYVEPGGATSLTAGGVNFYGAPGQRTDTGQRGPGYEVAKVTPEVRAVRSYSPDQKTIEPLRQLGFTTAVVAPARALCAARARWYRWRNKTRMKWSKSDVFQHIAFETGGEDERTYPGSLMGAIAVVRQSFFDAQHYALNQADWQKNPQGRKRPEFDPSLEALQPATDGKQRVLFEPGSALMVDRAARVARELKLDFAIVSCGQEWRRPDLAKETGATFIVPVNFPTLPKLPSEDDWEQVTLDNLRAWDWAAENPALLRQQKLDVALTTYSLPDKKAFRKNVKTAVERGLSETDALAALTTIPAKLCGVEKQLGTIEPGKIANLTIMDGKGYFDPESRVREVWVDGRNYHVQSAKESAKKDDADNGEKETKSKAEKEKKEAELKELQNKRVARSPIEGRGVITNPSAILIQNATVWTSSAKGVLTNASIWMPRGKIEQMGPINISWNGPEVHIDGKNLHVTPGLIDAHSHSAILGGVNESTLPSTAMVRIGDVVNSETKNISEELAGGLTTANLLHGSANPIGGQNQIIKLREGASPEEMKFEGAPQGIKFALGENVKQSNWGDRNTTRFPQSRTGVPTFHRNRFTAAQQYLHEWQEFRSKGGVPPRRDLELEAIGEIIEGKWFIHCHSYRRDEILAFLRTMEVLTSASVRSNTSSKATRWPTKSRSTAQARRVLPIGGLTSSRCMTRFPTRAR